MRLNNVFGFTFYALDIAQVPKELMGQFGKIEAILFSNNDLEQNNWEKAWKNISTIVDLFGNKNVSFHFPMDNCDYINSDFIKEKLLDAVNRANKLGLSKIVIHPNLRYSINEWQYIDRNKMQKKLYYYIRNIDKGNVKLCLENMPPIGNKYDDADSAILFTEDIKEDIDYTWDICHYFNVVNTMKEAQKDDRWKDILADIKKCDYLDFKEKLKNIQHYHFSAFEKIANPFKKEICNEGVLPNKSCISEEYYKKAILIIYADAIKNNKSIIFEITEDNYYKRKNLIKMLEWAEKIVDGE